MARKSDALVCPVCRNINLHQTRVTIYERGEDEEKVTKTTVDPGGSVWSRRVKNWGSGNPSSRRHGLAIRFECEHCVTMTELTFEQHKGETYLSWRRIDEPQRYFKYSE